jgi:hypothetical protein
MILAAMILLFFAQVHELFFPPASDTAVDVIFVLTFCCCVMDIIFRCIVSVGDNSDGSGYCPGYRRSNASTLAIENDASSNSASKANSSNPGAAASSSNLSKSLILQGKSQSMDDVSGGAASGNNRSSNNPQSPGEVTTTGHSNSKQSWFCGSSFSLGSFLFWCDVVSTLTLLTDVSFINVRNSSERHVTITLGASDNGGLLVRT